MNVNKLHLIAISCRSYDFLEYVIPFICLLPEFSI